MSTAHRPTWDPAAGKSDSRHLSQNFSAKAMPAHTRLKFRQPSQKQGITNDRRDLKAQLEKAEREARNKKRKEQGLEPEEEEGKDKELDEREAKRLKLVEASLLDRDDDDDDEQGVETNGNGLDKGKGKAVNPE